MTYSNHVYMLYYLIHQVILLSFYKYLSHEVLVNNEIFS